MSRVRVPTATATIRANRRTRAAIPSHEAGAKRLVDPEAFERELTRLRLTSELVRRSVGGLTFRFLVTRSKPSLPAFTGSLARRAYRLMARCRRTALGPP